MLQKFLVKKNMRCCREAVPEYFKYLRGIFVKNYCTLQVTRAYITYS